MSKVMSSNPFAGLSDETEPRKKPQQPKKPKAAPAPSTASSTAQAPTAKAPAKSAPPKDTKAPEQESQQGSGPKGQGGQSQAKPAAPRQANNNPAPAPGQGQLQQYVVGEDQPALVEKDKSFHGTKDRRDQRPARGPATSSGDHRPVRNRAYDRKSGTGRAINDNTTKGGAGKRNWGEETGDALLAEVTDAAKDAAVEKEGADAAPATGAEGKKPRKYRNRDDDRKEPVEEEEKKEEEKPTKSYEDFLAEQKKKKVKVPGVEQLKARTVEAGDLTGMTLLKRDPLIDPLIAKKKAETTATDAKEAEKPKDKAAVKPKKEKTAAQAAKEKEEEAKKKVIADIAGAFVHRPINDGEGRGPRGGRGGRGGNRGDRGDRGDRSERGDNRSPRDFDRAPGGRGRGGRGGPSAQAAPAAGSAEEKFFFADEDFPVIAPRKEANPASPALNAAAPTKA